MAKSLDEWAAEQSRYPTTAAVPKLPADILAQIETAARDPNGPGSTRIHQWLTLELGLDVTRGAVDYWYSKIRGDPGAGHSDPV